MFKQQSTNSEVQPQPEQKTLQKGGRKRALAEVDLGGKGAPSPTSSPCRRNERPLRQGGTARRPRTHAASAEATTRSGRRASQAPLTRGRHRAGIKGAYRQVFDLPKRRRGRGAGKQARPRSPRTPTSRERRSEARRPTPRCARLAVGEPRSLSRSLGGGWHGGAGNWPQTCSKGWHVDPRRSFFPPPFSLRFRASHESNRSAPASSSFHPVAASAATHCSGENPRPCSLCTRCCQSAGRGG